MRLVESMRARLSQGMEADQLSKALKSVPFEAWAIPVVAGIVCYSLLMLAAALFSGVAGGLIKSSSRFWTIPTSEQTAVVLGGGCAIFVLFFIAVIGVGVLFVRLAVGAELQRGQLIVGSSLAAVFSFVPIGLLYDLVSSALHFEPTISNILFKILSLFINIVWVFTLGAFGGFLGTKLPSLTNYSSGISGGRLVDNDH